MGLTESVYREMGWVPAPVKTGEEYNGDPLKETVGIMR